MSLAEEVVSELVKVRQVFHTLVGKLHLPSETEINELRDFINTIGGKQATSVASSNPVQNVETPAPAPAATPAAPVAQGITPVKPDPLAGFSVEDLQRELAERQGSDQATGAN